MMQADISLQDPGPDSAVFPIHRIESANCRKWSSEQAECRAASQDDEARVPTTEPALQPECEKGPRRSSVQPNAAHEDLTHEEESTVQELGTDPSQGMEERRRLARVWNEWLGALATDSEAALAAALTYQGVPDSVRDEWLAALELDVDTLQVSRIAVFAPLLAVESDPERRGRILRAMEPARIDWGVQPTREYFRGCLPGGVRVSVIVSPLYLDFVQVLACAYLPSQSFVWVRRDPMRRRSQVDLAGGVLTGVKLEPAGARTTLNDLARTVISVNRRGEPLPEALRQCAHMFQAFL